MDAMSRAPRLAAAVACISFSVGGLCGVFVVACSTEQQRAVRDASAVVDTACQLAPVVSADASEVCVTTDELRRAIAHIVGERAGKAGASPSASASVAPATVLVRLR